MLQSVAVSILLPFTSVVLTAAPGAQSSAAAPGDRLRVFVDCGRCDQEHLRQTVGFVDYVADPSVADFHVLVTTQTTGGGGLSWAVQFIGQGSFQGLNSRLSFDTPATDTESDRNSAFERIFMLGLAGPATTTSSGPELTVTWTPPEVGSSSTTADPWKAWVFNLRASGDVSGERASSARSLNWRVSSNRTTSALKVNVSAGRDTRISSFDVGDQERIRSSRHSWSMDTLVVRSAGPRWSVGATGAVSHSSFSNIDHEISMAPAVEFNVFPYTESSRRSLTVHYAAGASRYRYTNLTIFDRMREVVPRHVVRISLDLQQPWGSVNVASSFYQHLQNLDRTRTTVNGFMDVRIVKGLSVNAFFRYERIRDQISLRKEAASDEAVLLGLQQLPTGYNYFANFGISFRFGSIFNSVVNSRLTGSPF
jgi:hypothetical protein